MMEIIEKAASAAKNLIPPKDGATDVHVRRWRLWIAGATFLNAAGLSIHIALACGFAAPFYGGFAQSADLISFKDDTTARRTKELPTLLLDAKQKQCNATGEAKRLYLDTYNELRAEYFQLTKREFPSTPCSDFQ